jgi:hypothetical protein
MTNTNNPLSYLGVRAQRPPNIITAQRAPAATDTAHDIGTIWIDQTAQLSYQLIVITAGVPTWGVLSPGASDVDTINALAPVAGNIVIAGGTNLTDVNGGNTVTLNLDPAITLATSVTAPIYASAAAMAINPVGALTVTGGTTIDINAAANQGVTVQLGDAAGVQLFEIEDSASATVATINSNGVATFVGMDGILGAVTPAAATATTITANTSVTSPIYTAAAADAVVQAGGANDVVLRLGDNAGATFLRIQDSDSVDVYTIDSNGGLATMAGLTVAGAFAQTAGTFNVGQDNAANAINIGAGNAARAITIGNGAGAHTVNIGSAAAGAIAIDTAAGISFDAATASNFTVTGAADLSLQGVGGSVNVTSNEAVTDAVNIEASNAAGGVTIAAGTGGLNFGNQADCTTIGLGDFAPTATRTISIGGGTVVTAAVTDTIDVGPDGATTNANSIKTVNVNTGGVTLGQVLTNIATGTITSGTHTVSIQSGNAAAGTVATNISTGTGTKTVNLGNADALTTCNIDAVTLINDSVNAATSINTGNSTGTVTIGNGLSGAIGIVGGAAVTVDGVGAVELNSSGAAINIGTDANNFAVNVGTAGTRTVSVGSNAATSALVLQSGTGEITMTGTVKQVDAEFVTRSGVDVTFRSSPILQSTATTGAVPSGVTGATNLMMFQEGFVLEEFIKGAGQTIIAPRASADGLLISLDQTATEGVEINPGCRANGPLTFTIGTSAAFFAECTFKVADVSGCEPLYFGFRKVEANNADYTTYTDFVGYGLNNLVAGGDAVIATRLNSGGINTTDTNDAWADAASHTLQVLVSAAGVVTFTFDGGAPTVTQAFTFDNADVVQFWYTHIFGAAAPGNIHWVDFKCGFQA